MIVCVNCQLQMKPIETGIVEEMMTQEVPYKVWSADIFACPGCGFRVIGRFAAQPITEHHQRDYVMWAKRAAYRFWSMLKDKPKAQPVAQILDAPEELQA